MIKGMPQVVEYESSATRLYYIVKDDTGREIKPDATPTIAIYNTSGTEKVSATNMTVVTASTHGYLDYDAQTAEFEVGETLTESTAPATAKIVGQYKAGASGTLILEDVTGTFANDKTITDSGSGSATSNGTLYLPEYYYDLDASSSSDYPVAQNYQAKISYDISSREFIRWIYFDVAFNPMCYPVVTTFDVDEKHPAWIVPDTWNDWRPAIQAAHADLCEADTRSRSARCGFRQARI